MIPKALITANWWTTPSVWVSVQLVIYVSQRILSNSRSFILFWPGYSHLSSFSQLGSSFTHYLINFGLYIRWIGTPCSPIDNNTLFLSFRCHNDTRQGLLPLRKLQLAPPRMTTVTVIIIVMTSANIGLPQPKRATQKTIFTYQVWRAGRLLPRARSGKVIRVSRLNTIFEVSLTS